MKKIFIILFLVFAVIFTGCDAKKEGEKTDYFDFTATEIVDKIKEHLIDFTPMGVVDNKEKTEKIATYGSITDVFNTNKNDFDAMIHYLIRCDDSTQKASNIYFYLDRNSNKAATRYLYHINAIAECIEPNVNTDDIYTAIKNGFDELDFAIYEGENFKLHASRDDKYFSASFYPIKNTKGE